MKWLAKQEFNIPQTGINKIEKVRIGGIEQYILVQSIREGLPILLMLHGGPGLPLPGVSCRGRDYVIATTTKQLMEQYTLVMWDQRGSGKTYSSDTPQASFHVQQFVDDAKELIHYIRDTYHCDKVTLVGHSWGSIIGLRLASEIPEQLQAYIGISQIINWVENDKLCLEWTLQQADARGNKKARAELLHYGNPPYLESVEQWDVLRKWMGRFNSMIYEDEDTKSPGMKAAISILLRSPDYTLRDVVSTIRGFQATYTQCMVEDFAEVQLERTITKLDIPVIFIHGKHDVHVYGQFVEAYCAKLEAPAGKRLIWMDKSSHMFHLDDARCIEQELIQIARTYKYNTEQNSINMEQTSEDKD